jgi:hypothetical protein
LSDNGDISDDGQGSAHVRSNDGDVNDEDDDTEDWAVWDKMTISVRHHFMPHLVIHHLKMDKCLFVQTNFFSHLYYTLIQRNSC